MRRKMKRALVALMERHKISEEEGYQKLRRLATDKNLKLAALEQRILDVADLLG